MVDTVFPAVQSVDGGAREEVAPLAEQQGTEHIKQRQLDVRRWALAPDSTHTDKTAALTNGSTDVARRTLVTIATTGQHVALTKLDRASNRMLDTNRDE